MPIPSENMITTNLYPRPRPCFFTIALYARMVRGTGAKDDAITTVIFRLVVENSSLIPPRKS